MYFYKAKGFAWLPILIIVGIVIVGGAAYLYVDPLPQAPAQIAPVTVTQENDPTNVPGHEGPNTAQVALDGSPYVPDMSQYTDTDFGFSFWYPSSQSVTVLSPQVNATTMYGPGTSVVKTIHAPEFSLDEVISPNMSVLSSVDAGCCGSPDDKYFFNTSAHTWMQYDDGGPKGGPAGTSPADVSNNTMGGLHIFPGYTRFGIKVIIPLSATHFLAIYSRCNDATDYACDWSSTNPQSGQNRFKAAIQTILATDPSVATPVSAAQQTATIQAEKDAYANNSAFSATPLSGSAPLTVQFSHPFSQDIAAPWISFGDASANAQMSCSRSGCTLSHTYTGAGFYDATLLSYPSSCTQGALCGDSPQVQVLGSINVTIK